MSEVVILFSCLSTGLIFSITTKKKKSFFKIQVSATPSRKENMVKVKEVNGSSLQARNSQQQQVLEHPIPV